MRQAFAYLGIATLLFGCTTSLATFTPAQTTPAGHVRVSGNVGANLPIGNIVSKIQEGKDRIEEIRAGDNPTNADVEDLTRTAAALVVSPPSVGTDFQLRVGLIDWLDVGVRYASGTIRGDTRLQFLGKKDKKGSFYGSIGVGFGAFAFGMDLPVPDEYAKYVQLENIQRYEFDSSILFGWSGKFGHLWFGPKVVYTLFSTDTVVALEPLPTETTRVSGHNFYYGGQLGFALGYKVFWIVVELTAAGVSSHADSNPLGNKRSDDTSAFLLYPAAGVLFQF